MILWPHSCSSVNNVKTENQKRADEIRKEVRVKLEVGGKGNGDEESRRDQSRFS